MLYAGNDYNINTEALPSACTFSFLNVLCMDRHKMVNH